MGDVREMPLAVFFFTDAPDRLNKICHNKHINQKNITVDFFLKLLPKPKEGKYDYNDSKQILY